jgi:hypothetical protein
MPRSSGSSVASRAYRALGAIVQHVPPEVHPERAPAGECGYFPVEITREGGFSGAEFAK